MRICVEKGVLVLILVRLVSISAAAQQSQAGANASYRGSALRQSAKDLRPMSPEEGLAVLGAALDSRHQRGFTSDCSHFVHGLYQRAGFPYAYASSADLYSGIDPFERVTMPQAGDLVVWRGHVGIVVNPMQHSFFSLLRTGRGVESYDSPYWRRRGHPRFFRYVKGNPDVGLGTSVRSASLKPTLGEDDESREFAAGETALNRAGDLSPASDRPSARIADAPAESAVIPRFAIVNSAHPTPDQVRSAFLQSCADSEESLRGHDIFRSAQPVVVFDHFIVRKLHLAGTQGWAEIEIEQLAYVTAGRSETRNHSERQRWPLIRRTKTTWELTPPQSAIYLPQNVAAHLTAQRLAQLTKDGKSNADQNQKTELAQLLNVLLQK
jgi:hypothetical protein